MRRITLLGLLGLALSTVALASSIDSATEGFTAATGPLNFTASSSTTNYFNPSGISVGNPWRLTLVGSAGGDTIRVDITSLSGCTSAGSTCNFSGMVEATGPGVPGTFTDSLSGTILRGANGMTGSMVRSVAIESLTGTLAPGGPFHVAPDSNVSVIDVSICTGRHGGTTGCDAAGIINGSLRSPQGSGTMDVDVHIIPEPGTLGMLGTGLIGLAGLARRKLKLLTS